MQVAKLSTDKVVKYLKEPQKVQFDRGLHCLVSNKLTDVPSLIDPYWVPSTQIVWVMGF